MSSQGGTTAQKQVAGRSVALPGAKVAAVHAERFDCAAAAATTPAPSSPAGRRRSARLAGSGDVYAHVDNDREGLAPRNAATLRRLPAPPPSCRLPA